MFFGLCNSPATFQMLMDDVFQAEVNEGWLIIYMDDVFMFTKDKETNLRNTKQILQKCQDEDLVSNQKNVSFGKPR